MKESLKDVFYYFGCFVVGGIFSLIIWLFLFIMKVGIYFIWEFLPSVFDVKFYPLIVCSLGGLLIGLYLFFTKTEVLELDKLMEKPNTCKKANILFLCGAALLPLLFGGSIGPEAGLCTVVVSLSYWASSNMKFLKGKINDIFDMGVSSVLAVIFATPLFGLIAPVENKKIESEKTKMFSVILCVLGAFLMFSLLKTVFGGGLDMPRISEYSAEKIDFVFILPLALLGTVLGILYLLFDSKLEDLFSKIKKKYTIILTSLLGGVILGLFGTFFPLAMFSGEENFTVLMDTYLNYVPLILIFIGVLKLFLTSICVRSGWKGGHFFPIIFSGISVGYGVSMIFGLDSAFCLAVITAALLGSVMRKPVAVTLLLMFCFNVHLIAWILGAAIIGSIFADKIRLKTAN